MRDQLRLVAWLLMVVGGLTLVVSALADPLALGMPGSSFGLKQAAGCVLGALIAFGGWRFHRRLDRADARDDQRALQRRQQAAATATATATPAAGARPLVTATTQAAEAADSRGYGYGSSHEDLPDTHQQPTRTDAAPAPPTASPAIRTNLAETRAMADTTELPRLPGMADADARPRGAAHDWADDDVDDLDAVTDADTRAGSAAFDQQPERRSGQRRVDVNDGADTDERGRGRP